MAHRLADAHGLGEHQLVVDRSTFEAAQDRIALLRQALDDLDREDGGDLPADLEQAYLWLRRHAVEVAELQLLPAWQAGLNGR